MRALRACVVVLWALGGLVLAAGAVGAAERHYQDVVELTFPTEAHLAVTPISDGSGFIDDFDHGRGNECGVHRATDIMGSHGVKVYAARAGTVTMARTGSHNWLRIEGDDGYRHAYLHLGRNHGPRDEAFAPGIEEGVDVERGEHIGYMGSSGNASESGPHLHFELHHRDLADTPCVDSGWGYYNPYNSLVDAADRGDLPGGADEPEQDSEGDAPAPQPLPDHVDRVRGATRVHTAAELAASAYPDGAEHVILAPAYSFPEAIAAGPLAAAIDGPVVTTGPEELHPRAVEALESLDPERVTLVGGFDVLSREVADAVVADAGVHADHLARIAGDDPAGTAAAVAAEVVARTGTAEAVVARGADPEQPDAWPDALTGGWYGAATGTPVLLVTPDSVPEATADALADLDSATIVGGTAAVGEDVAAAVGERVDTVTRLAGDSRFATAVSLVDALIDTDAVSSERVWAATGGDYADALAAAPVVAADGGALVLIDGHDGEPRDGLGGWFDDRDGDFATGRAVGGTDAISDFALRTLADRID